MARLQPHSTRLSDTPSWYRVHNLFSFMYLPGHKMPNPREAHLLRRRWRAVTFSTVPQTPNIVCLLLFLCYCCLIPISQVPQQERNRQILSHFLPNSWKKKTTQTNGNFQSHSWLTDVFRTETSLEDKKTSYSECLVDHSEWRQGCLAA